MKAGEIEKLHFVQVYHTLFELLVPTKPGLLFFLQLFKHVLSFNWVVFSVHGNKVAIERNRLSKSNSYHDELRSEFGSGVNFTVKLVILLDPVHWADWNVDSIIASGTIIVCNYDFVN